jgi:hypothetical protein
VRCSPAAISYEQKYLQGECYHDWGFLLGINANETHLENPSHRLHPASIELYSIDRESEPSRLVCFQVRTILSGTLNATHISTRIWNLACQIVCLASANGFQPSKVNKKRSDKHLLHLTHQKRPSFRSNHGSLISESPPCRQIILADYMLRQLETYFTTHFHDPGLNHE